MLHEIIIASMLGFMEPSLPPTQYSVPPYVRTVKDCPGPDKAKALLPEHDIRNLVAEFSSYGILKDQHLNELIALKEFHCHVYNLESEITGEILNHNLMLTKEEQINFLQTGNFHIIKFYERNDLNALHSEPSAIIYKTEKITYVLLDLKGPKGLADGKFEYVKCYDYWSPDLVTETADEIIKIKLEKNRDYANTTT